MGLLGRADWALLDTLGVTLPYGLAVHVAVRNTTSVLAFATCSASTRAVQRFAFRTCTHVRVSRPSNAQRPSALAFTSS